MNKFWHTYIVEYSIPFGLLRLNLNSTLLSLLLNNANHVIPFFPPNKHHPKVPYVIKNLHF